MLSAELLHERAKQANSAGRLRVARRLLRLALDRDPSVATRSKVEATLGFVEAELGDPQAGFAHLTSALSRRKQLSPDEVGVIHAQRALVWMMLGHPRDSLADLAQAIPRLSGHPIDLGRAHMTRGNIYLQQGQITRAIGDFEAAAAQFELAEVEVQRAKARHNLGYAAMLTGDLIRALQEMEAAAEVLVPQGDALAATCDQDRAVALLSAGMVEEGTELLDRAARQFGALGYRRLQAEAEYALANTLTGIDPDHARRVARRASSRFSRAGADAWAVRAEAIAVSCAVELGKRSERAASELATRLAALDLPHDAAVMQLSAMLARVRAGGSTSDALMPTFPPDTPIATQLMADEIRVEIAIAQGDRKQALAHARSGISRLVSWQSTFASLDLRTSLVANARQLTGRALELALQEGSPAAVYEWVERTGAMAGRIAPVRPPSDPQTAADLTELRVLAQGTLRPGSAEAARQEQLLRQVRQRSWQDAGSARLNRLVPLAEVKRQLAATDATLIAPFTVKGQAWALVVRPRQAHVVPLGPLEAIRTQLAGLPADLDLAAADLPPMIAESVRHSLRERMETLDRLTLGPLAPLITSSRVVLNPTGLFSGLCWSLLPSLQGKAITIPRSASAWVSDLARPHEYATAGFAAGPRLERATPEVLQASGYWEAPEVLIGERAHSEAVSSMAGRVDCLHLAAHGRHVSENPLFSNLELIDGPWFGYDLDQLAQIPETVILSACELGTTTIRRGDELLGLTTAWLHAGARCVIAAPASVSDEVAAAILPDVHRELASGTSPADALAKATADRPEELSTFQCYGSGW
ncbi:MAG: CHAT domain-containing protein [Micropruina sp.]|nr:CHAT domain-containing protein [Micropruina sp.]